MAESAFKNSCWVFFLFFFCATLLAGYIVEKSFRRRQCLLNSSFFISFFLRNTNFTRRRDMHQFSYTTPTVFPQTWSLLCSPIATTTSPVLLHVAPWLNCWGRLLGRGDWAQANPEFSGCSAMPSCLLSWKGSTSNISDGVASSLSRLLSTQD